MDYWDIIGKILIFGFGTAIVILLLTLAGVCFVAFWRYAHGKPVINEDSIVGPDSTEE